MDVEEIRAAARLAPEHEAEPTPPIDQDKALIAFMERFADAMLSTAEAAVVALDKACEQITGVKPLPGEGARALYQAAEKALLTAVKQAINPPPLSPEALLVKEAAIVAAATATSVADVVDGMKKLADGFKPAKAFLERPIAHLWINGFPAAQADVRSEMDMDGSHHVEFSFTPGPDAIDAALRAHEAVRLGHTCMLKFDGVEHNVDHEFIGRFADAMRDGIMVGFRIDARRIER